MSEFYELVIYTSALPDYADFILDQLDCDWKIQHRLYRQHVAYENGQGCKDLLNLGRDMSKTILLDNLPENFMDTTPTNGLQVESWYDDYSDNTLNLLTPFLK